MSRLGSTGSGEGAEIHVGPGQEQHLAHEAWHVTQQKHGRVQANLQAKGVGVNDDAVLEKEAESMGARVQYRATAAQGLSPGGLLSPACGHMSARDPIASSAMNQPVRQK